MTIISQLASGLRDVHFGKNWTSVSLKEILADVTWQQATTKINSFNTIAALVYHTNYFVFAILNVLRGNPLDAHDKFSFDHPHIDSQDAWEALLEKTWADAEACASFIEKLPEFKLWEDFWENKYGNYYRNILGVIEHTHYHLGQIVLLKRMLIHSDQ